MQYYGCISYWGSPLEVVAYYLDNPQDWMRNVEYEVEKYATDRGRLDTMEVFDLTQKEEFHARLNDLLKERESQIEYH